MALDLPLNYSEAERAGPIVRGMDWTRRHAGISPLIGTFIRAARKFATTPRRRVSSARLYAERIIVRGWCAEGTLKRRAFVTL